VTPTDPKSEVGSILANRRDEVIDALALGAVELHDAHRVDRLSVVADHVLGHPDVAGAPVIRSIVKSSFAGKLFRKARRFGRPTIRSPDCGFPGLVIDNRT
jgi:hypothetical protein